MVFRHDPDGEHDDDDGDELQQHAQPHQFLRAVRRTAAHHVDEAEQQHERDRADCDRDRDVDMKSAMTPCSLG